MNCEIHCNFIIPYSKLRNSELWIKPLKLGSYSDRPKLRSVQDQYILIKLSHLNRYIGSVNVILQKCQSFIFPVTTLS